MGGFGSGKWSDLCQRKTSAELCRKISIRFLKDNGFLDADRAGSIVWKNAAGEVLESAELETFISADGDKTYLELTTGGIVNGKQKIELTTTPCNYGGVRWWFICPVVKDGVYCGNRVAKLLLPPAAKFFGCRECYDLTYESCQKSHKYDKIIDHIPDDMDLSDLNLTQVLRLASL
jgi:hypothetical protein